MAQTDPFETADDFFERVLYPALNECADVTGVDPDFDPSAMADDVLSVTLVDGSEWRITVTRKT